MFPSADSKNNPPEGPFAHLSTTFHAKAGPELSYASWFKEESELEDLSDLGLACWQASGHELTGGSDAGFGHPYDLIPKCSNDLSSTSHRAREEFQEA